MLSLAATPSHSPSRLADLVAAAHRTIERSRALVDRATSLCIQSREASIASQAWANILIHLPADSSHTVVLCARCHRARAQKEWANLPAGVEHGLRTWDQVLLSHGYCPECMRELEANLSPPAPGIDAP